MNTEVLERAFKKMGARAKIYNGAAPREDGGWFVDRRRYTLDIRNDKDGEFFQIRSGDDISMQVQHIAAKDRHLLLHVAGPGKEKSKFLCGHDERHWFVAAIPESAPVTTVESAKDALRPERLSREGNWIRQGEWFFIPCPRMVLPRNSVTFPNEPLVRYTSDGRGGKPHIATEAYRTGGEQVWVHRRFAPQGFTAVEWNDWVATHAEEFAKHGSEFQRMARNASVFVRGEVRHPDHATLKLGAIWHEVLMNRESESKAMASMVFLD